METARVYQERGRTKLDVVGKQRPRTRTRSRKKNKLTVVVRSALLLGMVALFVWLLITSLLRYTSIIELSNQVNDMETELKTLHARNDILNIQLSEAIDPEQIREIAVGRLGMTKPLPEQFIALDLEDDSQLMGFQFTTEAQSNLGH